VVRSAVGTRRVNNFFLRYHKLWELVADAKTRGTMPASHLKAVSTP
jgi:hypothetical protein